MSCHLSVKVMREETEELDERHEINRYLILTNT